MTYLVNASGWNHHPYDTRDEAETAAAPLAYIGQAAEVVEVAA